MPRVTGSKDANSLRIKLDGKGRKDPVKKSEASAVILLSVQNNKFCRDKWFSTIVNDVVIEKAFFKATFLIVDELQIYNLALEYPNSSEQELLDKSKELRDKWWREVENAFISLFYDFGTTGFNQLKSELSTIPVSERIKTVNSMAHAKNLNFNIICWQDWLNSCPAYLERDKEIISQYSTQTSLITSLEDSVNDFVKRHDGVEHDISALPNDKLIEASSKFLLHESPRLMIIAAWQGYDYIAYPGDELAIFRATREHFTAQRFPDKTNWLVINFKRVNKLASNTNADTQSRNDKTIAKKEMTRDGGDELSSNINVSQFVSVFFKSGTQSKDGSEIDHNNQKADTCYSKDSMAQFMILCKVITNELLNHPITDLNRINSLAYFLAQFKHYIYSKDISTDILAPNTDILAPNNELQPDIMSGIEQSTITHQGLPAMEKGKGQVQNINNRPF